ncbi:uncharacterized protein LOC128962371 [Oppia nitens]|uniref:uncharacterized protein LOC128962371 n=1 Tax=Oppia nitens TaxID=1686743 RepID=UPI0023DAF38E|nr:uncharacterized protein LOC128962371 [Oppia nitens]
MATEKPHKDIDDLMNVVIIDKHINQKPRSVLVDKFKMRSNKVIDNCDKQLDITRVDNFVIDERLEVKDSKEFPKLKTIKELFEFQRIDLEIGFKECLANNGLIADYEIYRTKKWYHYLQRTKEYNLITKYKPKFVSFGGPVADIMATIYDTHIGWKISAEMVNDVIYFYKTRHERSQYDNPSDRVNRRSYCLLNFFQLATDRDETDKSEYIKHFAINCVQLGSHRLMTLNEVDAIDDNGQSVDLKLVNLIRGSRDQQFFEKKKLLRFWSKAFIQGMDKIVIANIDDNYLKDIEVRKVSEIPESGASYWSSGRCIELLKRFLKFMKSNVKEERIVYDFDFNRGEEYVACYQTNDGKHVIPVDYNNHIDIDNDINTIEATIDSKLQIF